MRTLLPRVLLLALLCVLLAPGCRSFTKEAADEEVYALLDSRRSDVAELQGTLDIESKERLAEAIRKREAFLLTLRDALELGTVASRDYRRQRENVYIAALDLTRALNRFRPLWDAGGSLDVRGDENGSQLDASLGLTLQRAFERGGSVVIGLASDFLRDLSGDPLRVAQSILNASVTLPLMRGSGELVARESLTQAERNLMYALRTYARFQQSFTVDIATRFYRALQSRDSWQNSEARYKSLTLLVAEQRDQAEAGRLPKFEVDQVEQDLLASDDTRQRRKNAYVTAIDRLKLDLGIPVTAEVELDDSDLEALRKAGPQAAPHSRESALELALARRLDLHTQRDREADAQRQVLIAKDGLRAGLDLRLGGDLSTPREQPLNFGRAEASGRAGIDLDLPLERTAERNAHRRALIDAGRARRDRERLEDTVVFEVRDAYRSLAEARRSYEIQKDSLGLAERRVESTELLLERGDVKTRDRLDAENSLVSARNAVTAALVDHALALLGLDRDVGTLRVDAEGMWQIAGSQDSGTPTPTRVVQPEAETTNLRPPEVRTSPSNDSPQRAPLQSTPAPTLIPAQPAPATRAAAGDKARQPAPTSGVLPPPQVIPRRSGTVGSR